MSKLAKVNREALEDVAASLSVAAYIAYIITIISIVYKVLKNYPVSRYYFEIVLLCSMSLSISVHRILIKKYDLPLTLMGKKTVAMYRRPLKQRILHYFLDSTAFSFFFLIVVHFVLDKDYVFSLISENKVIQTFFELCMAISFTFVTDFAWFEYNIYRYKKERPSNDKS